jgi:hypothetical protein
MTDKPTNQRPLAVTAIAWLFIASGVFGFVVHLREIILQRSFHSEDVWVVIIPILAIAAGIFTLRGQNWARWLAVVWMGAHVAISFYDSWQRVVIHAVLFMLIAYALFDARARIFFRHAKQM